MNASAGNASANDAIGIIPNDVSGSPTGATPEPSIGVTPATVSDTRSDVMPGPAYATASIQTGSATGRRANRWNRRIRLTFMGVLRAELLKLKSLTSTWILMGLSVLLIVGMAALGTWSTMFMASVDLNTGQQLDSPRPVSAADVWSVLASSGTTAALVFGIFGVMAITSEYTTSAVQASLVANPRRGMFYIGKSLAVALFSVAASLVGIAAAGLVVWVMSRGHEITALDDDQIRIIPVTLVGFPVVIMLVALLAVGLGGLTRSTVGGVCAVIVLFMVLSSVLSLTSVLMNQFEWLGTLSYLAPDAAMNRFLSGGIESSSVPVALEKPSYWIPSWWQSGLLLFAWSAVLWGIGLVIVKRIDVK